MVYHSYMVPKGLLLPLPLSLVLFLGFACGTAPETAAPPEPAASQAVSAPVPAPSQTASAPEPAHPQTVSAPEPQAIVQHDEPDFDPDSISDEQFAATKIEVQAFIADLNRIIRARNYTAWVDHLADSYFSEMSSQSFLQDKTEELYRRDQIVAQNIGRDPRQVERRILRTPIDYFNLIVVPSRSNDRVDDISFVSETKVIAYTVDTRGNRLILYDLEIIDGKWKIIS